MAKNMKRILAITMALALCFMLMAPTAAAKDNGNNGSGREYIQISVNGQVVETISGPAGDHTWLIQGTYSYTLDFDKETMVLTYTIGKQSGTYTISLPAEYEGYTIGQVEMACVFNEEDSTNSQSASFDNAKIEITIISVVDPDTDEEIIIPTNPDPSNPDPSNPDPTEPDPSNPDPTEPDPTEPDPTVPDPVDYAPVLSIVKTADKEVYEVGETITWTITVTNTGDDTAYGIVIEDPVTGDTWEIDYLAAGESCTLTATSTADLAGSLENIATVSWTDNDEIPDEEEPDEPKEDSDTEIVTIEEPVIPDPVDYEPALSIVKTADKEVYEVGETVTWTITVTNTSNYLAYDVEIVDPVTGDTWYIGYLIPGASRSFTVTVIAEEAGSLENTAIVTWTDGDEIPDEEETDEPKEDSDTETVTIEEPESTEPDPTEPDPTEPEVTEPEVTEPEVTEPEATEPEVTEPEVTEPEVTEPEVTEPEVTEPEVTEPDPTEPEVTEPSKPAEDAPAEPAKTNDSYEISPYTEIPDEDVPLADVPVTGDLAILWTALSVCSGVTLVAVNKKREED